MHVSITHSFMSPTPARGMSLSNTSTFQKCHCLPITTLFKEKSSSNLLSLSKLPEIRELNDALNWQVARINALYEAIYQQGVVTEEDLPKLNEMEALLNAAGKTLALDRLTSSESAYLTYVQREGKKAVDETRELIKDLEKYDQIVVKLNTAMEICIDTCHDPRFEGRVLESASSLQEVFLRFKELQKYVENAPKSPNSIARVHALYKEEAQALEWMVEDWIEMTQAAVYKEFNELKQALASTNKDLDRTPLLRQLQALKNQLKTVAQSLSLRGQMPLRSLQSAFDAVRRDCKSKQKEIEAMIAKENSYQFPYDFNHSEAFLSMADPKLAPLLYGSPEWIELSKSRSLPEKGRAAQIVQHVAQNLEPANWSNRSKQIAYTLFNAMQLSAGAIEFLPSSATIPPKTTKETESAAPHALTQKIVSPVQNAQPLAASASKMTGMFPTLLYKIGSFLNAFSAPMDAPSNSAFIEKTAAKGYTALRDAQQQLKGLQEASCRFPPLELNELRQEIALLYRELMKTASETPPKNTPLLKLAAWCQAVEDKCYAVEALEMRISTLMEATRERLSASDVELKNYGKKHKNNVLQARLVESLQIPGLSVPLSQGVSSDAVYAFLLKEVPALFEHWKALGTLYKSNDAKKSFLDQPQVAQYLKEIREEITKAFTQLGNEKDGFQALGLPETMRVWLDEMKERGYYLMVRSTGAEDSRQAANAGGNLSKSYVRAQPAALFQAMGEVVQSYFGPASLQNRLNAETNPFEEELKLAVTVQELIGEPIGGASKAEEIPVSVVLFTNEPLYVGDEKFRVMRISAAYGHGEGVVGNRGISTDTALLLISEAHPDKIHILYDNQVKLNRLAPLLSKKGVSLEKVPNPSQLQHRRVLDDALLLRLYHWGIVAEKFFDDHATDMEIVIKEGTIYPVQARDVNRRAMLPTYLDARKVAALSHSPLHTEMKGEMIVPGKGSVAICTKSEEVLYAPTLEQAEKLYKEGSGVKLIVVSEPEPANSHPVVNFSGLGMPCLLIENGEQIKKMIESIAVDLPLVACVQTATVQLIDKTIASPEALVSEGFAIHPAKITLSMKTEEKLAQSSRVAKVPQEIKDLLLDLRSALTVEVASQKLKELKTHAWIKQVKEREKTLAAQLKSFNRVPLGAQQALHFLGELGKRIDHAFEEVQAHLLKFKTGERLKPLFHAKVLEKTLFADSMRKGIAQYTVSDAEPIFEAAQALIAYQKKLPHTAHFSAIQPAAYQALGIEAEEQWTQFLFHLEPLAEAGMISTAEKQQLQQLIATLDQAKVLPAWLTFFFPKIIKDLSPLEQLQQVLHSLPPEQGEFINYLLEEKESIQEMLSQLDAFGDPDHFQSAWEQLLKLSKHLTIGREGGVSFKDKFAGSPPIVRLMAVTTMQNLVEVFDLGIKEMKMKWPLDSKPKQFKMMLQAYHALLKSWLLNIEESKQIPLSKISSLQGRLESIIKKINSRSEHSSELKSSDQFSVTAAMLGTTSQVQSLPETLEDLFTLIHQDLIVCISNLSHLLLSDEMIEDSSLPSSIKEIFKNLGVKTIRMTLGRQATFNRVSVHVDSEKIEMHYNIPLRDHSAQLTIGYHKASGLISFDGHFVGPEERRWPRYALMANILSEAGILPLSKPAMHNEYEASFSWRIESAETFKIALEEFSWMIEDTFNYASPSVTLREMCQRREGALLDTYIMHSLIPSALLYQTHLENFIEQATHPQFTLNAVELETALTSLLIPSEIDVAWKIILKDSLRMVLPIENIAEQQQLIDVQDLQLSAKTLLKTLVSMKESSNAMVLEIAKKMVDHFDWNVRQEGRDILYAYFKKGYTIPAMVIGLKRAFKERYLRTLLIEVETWAELHERGQTTPALNRIFADYLISGRLDSATNSIFVERMSSNTERNNARLIDFFIEYSIPAAEIFNTYLEQLLFRMEEQKTPLEEGELKRATVCLFTSDGEGAVLRQSMLLKLFFEEESGVEAIQKNTFLCGAEKKLLMQMQSHKDQVVQFILEQSQIIPKERRIMLWAHLLEKGWSSEKMNEWAAQVLKEPELIHKISERYAEEKNPLLLRYFIDFADFGASSIYSVHLDDLLIRSQASDWNPSQQELKEMMVCVFFNKEEKATRLKPSLLKIIENEEGLKESSLTGLEKKLLESMRDKRVELSREALEIAKREMSDKSLKLKDRAASLLRSLFQGGYEITQVIKVAELGLHASHFSQFFSLWTGFIKKGQGIKEFSDAIGKVYIESDEKTRDNIDSFLRFNPQFYEAWLNIVKLTLQDPNEYIKLQGQILLFEVMDTLLHVKIRDEEAINTSLKLLKDLAFVSTKHWKWKILNLFKTFVNEGYGLDEAKEVLLMLAETSPSADEEWRVRLAEAIQQKEHGNL